MTQPELPEPVILPVTSMRFCHSISVDQFNGKYSVSVPWQDVKGILEDICAEQIMKAKSNRWGLVTFTSNRMPTLHGTDMNDLRFLREMSDYMNLRFDSLLAGQPAELCISFWAKTRSQGEIGTSLDAIRIDASKIELPEFGKPFGYSNESTR